jgi:hypothetical protein
MANLFFRSMSVPIAYFSAGVMAVLFYEQVKPTNHEIRSTDKEFKDFKHNTDDQIDKDNNKNT